MVRPLYSRVVSHADSNICLKMVDRAVQLLTLHIMWKARSLPAAAELSPDEIQFRDKLKDERASLLEKLVEFAVGTQSNTVEGVRRAVRHVEVLFEVPVLTRLCRHSKDFSHCISCFARQRQQPRTVADYPPPPSRSPLTLRCKIVVQALFKQRSSVSQRKSRESRLNSMAVVRKTTTTKKKPSL